MRRIDLRVTTDSGGDATVLADEPVFGELHQMLYVPDGGSPLATGADIVVSTGLGVPIITEADIGTSAFARAPRQPVHGVADGAAIAGGYDKIGLHGDTLQIVVSQGGDTLSGTFYFWIG